MVATSTNKKWRDYNRVRQPIKKQQDKYGAPLEKSLKYWAYFVYLRAICQFMKAL